MRSLAFLTLVPVAAFCQSITLDLEAAIASTRYNRAAVPNPGGTDLNLGSLLGRQGQTVGRVQLTVGDRWRLVYAPFSQAGDGVLDSSSTFVGQTFAPGAVRSSYRFDSYRVTYRNAWRGGWRVGATLKLRIAEIALEQGATRASERNNGLVPLLHLAKEGDLGGGFGYQFEFDGLAGGPGRAFDGTFRLTRDFGRGQIGFLGYRILEGGADVPRVENFAWVNYFTAGTTLRF